MNATLNECGYCVGTETGLPQDFGRDCEGRCGGRTVRDCKGVCGGSSFHDECSGKCVDSSQDVDWSLRDCRGSCSSGSLSSYLFTRDACGVCRLRNESRSPFEDCDGRCLATQVSPKIEVCSKCIPNSEKKLLLDACGNCRSEGIPCSCDKDPSVCGCRSDNTCYSLRSIHPVFLPRDVTRKITLSGYFFPPVTDAQCILRHEAGGEVIGSPVRFEVGNRSSAACVVSLTRGKKYCFYS